MSKDRLIEIMNSRLLGVDDLTFLSSSFPLFFSPSREIIFSNLSFR